MEPDVVASYTDNASIGAKRRLSELKQEGLLRDYKKQFTTVVQDIREMGERKKLNFFWMDYHEKWSKTFIGVQLKAYQR